MKEGRYVGRGEAGIQALRTRSDGKKRDTTAGGRMETWDKTPRRSGDRIWRRGTRTRRMEQMRDAASVQRDRYLHPGGGGVGQR